MLTSVSEVMEDIRSASSWRKAWSLSFSSLLRRSWRSAVMALDVGSAEKASASLVILSLSVLQLVVTSTSHSAGLSLVASFRASGKSALAVPWK